MVQLKTTKKPTNMKKTNLLTALYLCLCFFGIAQQIPSTYWGINHWMPKKYLNNVNIPNGRIETSAVQQLVTADGCIFYRIGGDGYDEYGDAIGADSTSNDYIRAMQIIRANNPNSKFLIQIPYKVGTFNADSAAKLVGNILLAFPNEHHYYAIGNEWDRYRNLATQRLRSSDIASVMLSFAVEMKAADPQIKIVAPSLSYFSVTDSLSQPIMNRLIGGADNITQIITGSAYSFLNNSKFYVDVINFHSYGGSNGNLSTATNATTFNSRRSGLINYAGAPNTGFSDELDDLITLLNSANSSRSSSPLTFAITEMNVCYENQPTPVAGDKYTNSTQGISARSFFAGQQFADLMSTALEKGTASGNAKVEFVMPWSIHEAGGNGGSGDLSMTKGSGTSSAPTPVSSYYHYKLMADHFFGKYYPSASNTQSPAVKAFASVEDSAGVYVMILNRDSVTYPYRLDLQNSNPSGSQPLKLGFTIPSTILALDSAFAFDDTINGNTTILVLYNCHGKKLWKMKYNLADADSNIAPHFKQIGNRDVDPDWAYCETNMIQGEITSDVTYSNTTIFITGNVVLKGTTKLILDNVIAVISPSVLIKAENNTSIEVKNGSVLFGCNGPWEGLELAGSYSGTEKLLVENSYIYNARYPIKTKKVSDILIKGNMIANGIHAITLDSSQAFRVEKNAIGCFDIGIKTSNTAGSFNSTITENHLIHQVTGLTFIDDQHTNLNLSCNIVNFKEGGILSQTTFLSNLGNSMVSGGNVFQKNARTQADFIDHTGGNAPIYYYGPLEGSLYNPSTMMNINTVQSANDNLCAVSVVAAYTCKSLFTGVQDHSSTRQGEFVVYPNPSNGVFTLELKNMKDTYTLNVYDIMGRRLETRLIDFTTEQSVKFEIKQRGMYIVSLSNESGILTKKVIVE